METINQHIKNLPFGGKVMVLGRNFKQVLIIVPKGSRATIIVSSLNCSHLLPMMRHMKLAKSMRVHRLQDTDSFC